MPNKFMKYKKIPLNQSFRKPTRLTVKIKEAKERTRQWALGVNVEFPEMPIEDNRPRLTLRDIKPKTKAKENHVSKESSK